MLDNKNIQKIFSLGDIRKKQLLGEVPQRTRETYREYGYFGGGDNTLGGIRSTVDRIDYSNDTSTASARGPLSLARFYLAASGNSNFGYFGGGLPGPRSTVDRIDYSNDSATASVRGPLSLARSYLAATGNSNFGWFIAGEVSRVDRINYANDLNNASIRGNELADFSRYGSFGNSNYGWNGGGNNNSIFQNPTSMIRRIDYSNDLIIPSIRGPFTGVSRLFGATGNSNFGYAGGNFGVMSTVARINYTNDLVTASVRGPLSSGRGYLTATGTSNFGYFAGGHDQPGPNIFSLIDRIDYSNDTVVASIRGPLTSVNRTLSATSSHSFGGSPNSSFASDFTFPTVPNAGYFGGGSDGTNNLATIDKVDYANDTATASVRSALSSARTTLAAVGNSNFGYFAGGLNPGSTTVDRLEYSSDTQNTSTRTNLQSNLTQSAAVGNESFGYFAGGISQIQKINYSNDSTSIVGNIDDSRQLNAATTTRNFGYFSGGDIPEVSIIQRINFSNDTANALFRTNHAFNRRQHGGVGNETYGYFGGGVIAGGFSTLVERLDYSNDTTQPNIRGPLSLPRRGYLGATGSQNFGYFSGGDVPGPTYFSTIDRINYSNDTAVAPARGPLPVSKGSGAATSPLAYGGAPIYFTNPLPEVLQKQIEFDDSNTLDLPFKRVLGSYGYFGGGLSPDISTIERIDYSNDNTTASIRGPLSGIRRQSTGTGNSNFGYIIAGGISAPTFLSLIERIDYSNDSSNTSIRGNIDRSVVGAFSIGTEKYGYVAGGFVSNSRVQRIDYSSDNTIPVIKGSLNQSLSGAGAAGNNNFGYFAGGDIPSGAVTTVERISYSNDSIRPLIRGYLTIARSRLGGAGNNNFGYFGGGRDAVDTSIIERIDYSNDTTTASVRSNLVNVGYAFCATGNSNFGYFLGFPIASTHRLDYNNDTNTCILRGVLSANRYRAATTNARSS
jgi:hypothetical protein